MKPRPGDYVICNVYELDNGLNMVHRAGMLTNSYFNGGVVAMIGGGFRAVKFENMRACDYEERKRVACDWETAAQSNAHVDLDALSALANRVDHEAKDL